MISITPKQSLGNGDAETCKSTQTEENSNWWNAVKNKKIAWPEVKPVVPNVKVCTLG